MGRCTTQSIRLPFRQNHVPPRRKSRHVPRRRLIPRRVVMHPSPGPPQTDDNSGPWHRDMAGPWWHAEIIFVCLAFFFRVLHTYHQFLHTKSPTFGGDRVIWNPLVNSDFPQHNGRFYLYHIMVQIWNASSAMCSNFAQCHLRAVVHFPAIALPNSIYLSGVAVVFNHLDGCFPEVGKSNPAFHIWTDWTLSLVFFMSSSTWPGNMLIGFPFPLQHPQRQMHVSAKRNGCSNISKAIYNIWLQSGINLEGNSSGSVDAGIPSTKKTPSVPQIS